MWDNAIGFEFCSLGGGISSLVGLLDIRSWVASAEPRKRL